MKLYCVEGEITKKLSIDVVVMNEEMKNKFKKLLGRRYKTPFIADTNSFLFDFKVEDYEIVEKAKVEKIEEKPKKEKRSRTLIDDKEGEQNGEENEAEYKENKST